ncbi:MAG: cytochrome b/b6 domain-containing protein [Hyphomicrobiaceae bacterium]
MTPSLAADRVRVWDLFVRLFHWSLVSLVLVAWLSSEGLGRLHRLAGYTIAALVVLRIIWGFAGSRHARFGDFVRGPGAIAAHLNQMLFASAPRHIGHNPPGGAMIMALIATILVACVSGHLQTTDAFWGNSTVALVHYAAVHAMLGLAVLHVAGVLFSSMEHRENLIAAMVTGLKRAADAAPPGSTARLTIAIGASILSVAAVLTLLAGVFNATTLDAAHLTREWARAVERQTGAKVAFAGPAGFRLLPSPRIVAEGVRIRFAGREVAGRALELSLGHISASLDPIALLTGEARVTALSVEGGDLSALADLQAAGFTRPALARRIPRPSPADVLQTVFQHARTLAVRDLVLRGLLGRPDAITVVRQGLVELGGKGSAARISLTGLHGTADLALTGSFLPGRSIDEGWAHAFDLAGTLGELKLSLSGQWRIKADPAASDTPLLLALSLEAPGPEALAPLAGTRFAEGAGDLRLTTAAEIDAGGARLGDLVLALGEDRYTGALSLTPGSDGAALSGELATGVVDLTGQTSGEVPSDGTGRASTSLEETPSRGLALAAALASTSSSVELRAGRLIIGSRVIEDARLQVVSGEARLRLDPDSDVARPALPLPEPRRLALESLSEPTIVPASEPVAVADGADAPLTVTDIAARLAADADGSTSPQAGIADATASDGETRTRPAAVISRRTARTRVPASVERRAKPRVVAAAPARRKAVAGQHRRDRRPGVVVRKTREASARSGGRKKHAGRSGRLKKLRLLGFVSRSDGLSSSHSGKSGKGRGRGRSGSGKGGGGKGGGGKGGGGSGSGKD